MYQKQSGNVLFLILIAVALFAALSYAVTSSTRGSGKDTSDEKIRTGAAAIQQYVALMRTTLQRMVISNGCTPDNFNWSNQHWIRIGGNPAPGIIPYPPVPKAGCNVFSSSGGPISDSIDFSAYAAKTYDSTMPTYLVKGGHAMIGLMTRKDTGTSATDIGIIFYGMDRALCSYLLNPVTKPQTMADHNFGAEFYNLGYPDNYTWTSSADIIDDPINLDGDFFSDFETIFNGPGCLIGAIILPR